MATGFSCGHSRISGAANHESKTAAKRAAPLSQFADDFRAEESNDSRDATRPEALAPTFGCEEDKLESERSTKSFAALNHRTKTPDDLLQSFADLA